MARKTEEEKLQELEKKLEQLQNQKKELLAKHKEKERKARTRRLIQLGALAEKYLDCTNIEPENFEKLLKQIVATEDVNMLLLSRKINEVDELEKKHIAEHAKV